MKETNSWPQFTQDDYEISNKESLYTGFCKMNALTLRHQTYQHGWSETIQRELLERPPAVGVLLYDPKRQEVVFVEQFRVGALTDPRSPWLLEIVAGMVDPGEGPEKTAIRETFEETGLKISKVQLISNYWVSPGASNEKVYLYYGEVDATQAAMNTGAKEEHEDILVKILPLAEVFQGVENGLIRNAMTLVAIMWLQLNYRQLT